MANRKTKSSKNTDNNADASSSDLMTAAFGSEKDDVRGLRIIEVANLLRFEPDDDNEATQLKIFAAGQALVDLAPKDELERMLIVQMIGSHAAAVECLRRAMIPDQHLASRDMNLKHAEKLMATYARQLETFNKHRGKGQQNITVKHVNVESGGQAIVGNVDVKKAATEPVDQLLTDTKEAPIDVTPSREASKIKAKG